MQNKLLLIHADSFANLDFKILPIIIQTGCIVMQLASSLCFAYENCTQQSS